MGIKEKVKGAAKPVGFAMATASIKAAVAEQGLSGLYRQLEKIVPDISDQYSQSAVDSEYLRTKVRGQHAFQAFMMQKALELAGKGKAGKLNVADIGDSSGTHVRYLKGLAGREIDALSINLDKAAVEKIRKKGLKAACMRAEEIGKSGFDFRPDLLMSFEMIEHLHDPSRFMKSMSETGCGYFLITVPYVKRSRVGLREIRMGIKKRHTAEDSHIFELSPEDWKLLFRHSGWEIAFERTYLQYPKFHPLRAWAHFFAKFDFEGFWGAVLKTNPEWKERYADW